jgi:hypothetical protein
VEEDQNPNSSLIDITFTPPLGKDLSVMAHGLQMREKRQLKLGSRQGPITQNSVK